MRGPADHDLWAPLKLSVGWLVGTYLLFLGVGEVTKVTNLLWLTSFVVATIACFTAGYWLRARRYATTDPPTAPSRLEAGPIKTITALSALYYLAYGVVYMREFGVLRLGALADAIRDPGSAYLAKFGVFSLQVATDSTNLGARLLTLSAALSAPLIPFLIVYWRRLTGDIKVLAAIGLGSYAALFLAIGTLVGLGNLLIFALVGRMVARGRLGGERQLRRGVTVLLALAGLAFAGYMSYNQSARLEAVGITSKYEPNPMVAALTSDDFARGVTVMAFYPTHGYRGLAYNLETPFEWTQGRGASRALDSYLSQYGVADSVADRTYPERTEDRVGWDAGFTWSTIYPWLASDLTFPGAALFMGVVGWWMARFWYEATVLGGRLSMLLLGQLAVLIAYVPANNQLGLSRPNLIALVTLLVCYALRPRKSEEASRHTESQRVTYVEMVATKDERAVSRRNTVEHTM